MRFISLISILSVALASHSVKGFPNPTIDADRCAQGLPGIDRICDVDHVLSAEQLIALQKSVVAIEERHAADEPCNGHSAQLAVVLLRQRMRGTAEAFARELHDAWGVGDKTCQDGILLLVALTDRESYLSLGSGHQNRWNDQRIQGVLGAMKVFLRANNPFEGLSTGVEAIGAVLDGPPLTATELLVKRIIKAISMVGMAISMVGMAIFGVVVCFILYSGYQEWRYPVRSEHAAWLQAREKLVALDAARKRRQAAEASEASPGAGAGGSQRRSTPPPLTVEMEMCPVCLDSLPAHHAGEASAADCQSQGIDGVKQRRLLPESAATPPVSDGPAEASRPTITLLCGHRFHMPCIDEWFAAEGRRAKDTCPVCRRRAFDTDGRPLPPDAPEATSAPRPQSSAGSHYRQAAHDDMTDSFFIIQSLHRRYPRQVPTRLVTRFRERIATPTGTHAEYTLATEPAFLSTQPRLPSRSTSTNGYRSGRSMRSFGGGSSSFGGGSRW